MASRRLGEILIAADLVSPDAWADLVRDEAAGVGLAMIGLLRKGAQPEAIAQALNAAGAEFHPADRFDPPPSAVFARIPAPVAIRWGVLPLLAGDGLLKVAMLDPFDPLCLQTLAEVTGARIEAGCANPLLLALAVDRVHGSALAASLGEDPRSLPLPPPPPPSEDPIPLTLRKTGEDDDIEILEPATGELADLFGEKAAPSSGETTIPLQRQAPHAPRPVAPTQPAAAPAPPAVRAPPPPATWVAAGPLSPASPPRPEATPRESPGPAHTQAPPASAHSTLAPQQPPVVAPVSTEGAQAAGHGVFARIALESTPAAAVADAPAERIEAPTEDTAVDLKEDFDFAITRLRIAETRDELGEAAILFLSRCFPRSALLSVRGRTITGWLAGGELSPEQLEVIKMESGQPTLFWEVLDTNRPFIGPLPEGRETLRELLITPPRQLAVFPVSIGPHPVALLYGDTVDARPMLARRDLLERLAEELGEALGELILQQKTEDPSVV